MDPWVSNNNNIAYNSFQRKHISKSTSTHVNDKIINLNIDNKNKLEKNHVAIILGYFNGQAFLGDQIKSIFNQSHGALHVFLCDDNSERPFDENEFEFDENELKKLSFARRSNCLGYAKNFLNALSTITEDYEYFAFSDQDDIWHRDKVERALKALDAVPSDTPALYCARTEITDETCERTLGFSPKFTKPPSFANAVVQNIGGGNTMIFNRAAKDLIINAALGSEVVSHDWWCYQIISGAGGHVFYDPEPCLKYRQHAGNLVGANTSWRARFARIRGLIRGRFREWNDINLAALSAHKHLLTKSNQRVLDDFVEARQSSLIKRLFLFKRSGIYRQTSFGNLGLLLGVFLNKV